MPQSWNEADFVADAVIGLDEIDEPRRPDRRHGIGEYRCHVLPLALPSPMRVLDAAHQITRIGEGWDPTAAGQHRVPPDVVDMQMRANDRVYGLASIAGRCQISEEIRL